MTRCALFAALLGLSAACGTDIESGIDAANDLLYQKQYVDAERLYRKLLRRIEDQGSRLDEDEEQERLLVLDRLGKLNALYLHDYDAAIRYYRQLVKLYPKTEQAFAALATVADVYQHKLGNLQAAIDAYQELVKEFPDRLDTRRAQLKVANAYFQLKDYEQARTEAEALINRWPDGAEAAQARFQIANSYYLQQRYQEAIATYERLLEVNPERELAAFVLFELGNCFQETNEMARALAYYYAALTDHPDPLLVQRKIKRVRKRIDKTKPADVELPAYLRDRLAAIRGLPFGVRTAAATPGDAAAALGARTGIDVEQPPVLGSEQRKKKPEDGARIAPRAASDGLSSEVPEGGDAQKSKRRKSKSKSESGVPNDGAAPSEAAETPAPAPAPSPEANPSPEPAAPSEAPAP